MASMTVVPSLAPKPCQRPDIVLLGSIRDSVQQLREELSAIGEEKRYATALRVMETQAKLVAGLARELLDRHEGNGVRP